VLYNVPTTNTQIPCCITHSQLGELSEGEILIWSNFLVKILVPNDWSNQFFRNRLGENNYLLLFNMQFVFIIIFILLSFNITTYLHTNLRVLYDNLVLHEVLGSL